MLPVDLRAVKSYMLDSPYFTPHILIKSKYLWDTNTAVGLTGE